MRSLKGWALAPTGTDAAEAGRDRPAARGRRGRIVGAAITAILAATMVPGAAAPASADVSGNGVGAIAANGFPSYFSDGTTKLALCDTVAAGCLGDMAVTNEGFYFDASAVTAAQPKLYEVALEATNTAALGNLAFTRIRMRIGGLVDGGTYTIKHPYGVNTFIAGIGAGKTGGVANGINFTSDAGCLASPCGVAGFNAAGAGFAGNYAAGFRPTFLTQSNRVAGMIGDINVPGTVTGAPSGVNAVIMTGPNAGGPGVNTLTVTQFAVQGLKSLAVTAPTVPNAPIILATTAGNGSALGHWTVPGNGGLGITKYHVRVVDGQTGTKAIAIRDIAGNLTSLNVTGLPGGTSVRFQVQAINVKGISSVSTLSNAATPVTKPGSPKIGPASPGIRSAVARWTAGATGGLVITKYHVRVVDGATGTKLIGLRDVAGTLRSMNFTGLATGTSVRFQVQAVNVLGMSAVSAHSNAVTVR